jgi:nitrogen-specific signal transduction histidine kinase
MLSHRDILEGLSAGVLAAAFDEVAVYANTAACELLGLPREHCLGQPVPQLFGMTLSLSEHEFDSYRAECRLDVELPTGPAGVTIRRLVGGVGFVCMFRTKSDGRRADAELARHEREASIGVLLSSFAHEARNPLAIIQASIETMRGELAGSDVVQRHLAVIERHLGRLSDLVRSPLLIAHLTSSTRSSCQVDQLVARAAAAVADEAGRNRVSIAVSVADTLPRVVVDERAVADAIAELLANAVQAAVYGGHVSLSGRVAYVATGDPRERRRVVLEIEDRRPAPLSSESPSRPGTLGIGLPRARQHIEQSGGRLAIESGPHIGTVVRVELPTEEPR